MWYKPLVPAGATELEEFKKKLAAWGVTLEEYVAQLKPVRGAASSAQDGVDGSQDAVQPLCSKKRRRSV